MACILLFQNHTPADSMRLRFTTDRAPGWDSNHGKDFAVVPDDTALRVYVVDLSGTPGWSGRLKQLWLDLATGTPLTGTGRFDHIWVGN